MPLLKSIKSSLLIIFQIWLGFSSSVRYTAQQGEGRKAWPLTQVHRRVQHGNTQGTPINSFCFASKSIQSWKLECTILLEMYWQWYLMNFSQISFSYKEGGDKWARLSGSNLNLLTQNRGKPYHPSPGLYSTLHAPFTSFATALPLSAKGTNTSANRAEVKPAEELTVFCQVTDKISSSNGQLRNRIQQKRRGSSALMQAKRKCWK